MNPGQRPPVDPERWLQDHGDSLFRYAFSRVHRRDVAEDLVQETLIAALRNHRGFSGGSSEKTWLFGIMKHKIVDHFRSYSREVLTDQPDTADQNFDSRGVWTTAPQEWTKGPDSSYNQREFWMIFTRCLATLSAGQQSVFVLRELEGLSTEEICKVLQISSTNLWVRLHRARLQLRRCLEEHWFSKK